MNGWRHPAAAGGGRAGAALAAALLAAWAAAACGRMPPAAEAEVPPPALAAAREAASPGTPAGSCYLGVLLASESVELVAEVAGRVRQVAVRPGDAVAAGALLATLTADGLRDELAIEQANLAGARSDLAAAEVEVRRAGEEHRRRLALAELVSRETIAAAAFELEAATRRRDGVVADVAAAGARLDRLQRELAGAEVRAPFAGTVAARYVDPGGAVTHGTPLVRLIGGGPLRVRFAVPPAEADRLRPGQPLTVALESPALTRRATLERIAPEIDAASETVFAEARIAAPAAAEAGLPSGALVRVSPLVPDGASCFAPPDPSSTPNTTARSSTQLDRAPRGGRHERERQPRQEAAPEQGDAAPDRAGNGVRADHVPDQHELLSVPVDGLPDRPVTKSAGAA
jgi:membrane fusion protein, multidrug efflux system